MTKNRKASPLNSAELCATIRIMLNHHHHGWGLAALGGVLVALALLAGLQMGQRPGIYLAGEIAARDVVADRDMLIEDTKSTQARREQAMALQPMVFDLDKESMARFRDDALGLLHGLNTKGLEETGLEEVRKEFNERHGSELSASTFRVLADEDVQSYVLKTVMPWLEGFLAEGVLPDMRQLSTVQNAIIVRDVDTGAETLRTQAGGLHDQRSLVVALGQSLRSTPELRSKAKAALLEVLPLLVMPTLAVNQDATNQRNAEVLRAVEPVLYRVQKGEVVVRAGDMVSHEQQLKMQSLFGRSPRVIDWGTSVGVLMMGFFLMVGLFMTPSGNKGTVLRTKDQNFIALLLVVFGVAAWGVSYLFFTVAGGTAATALTYAFPAAGGAGLAALIFSARRYCTIGLLLSFFATLMFKGDLALFFFYFLSCMVNTWLVLRAQSRQDVVWSGLPLFAWLLITGLGAAALGHMDGGQLPTLLVALGVNALLSVLLLFALSPILEMVMGYTTRFRLMELMNLEQPLLQDLMMTIPGTYHHSLVVSNLVEAGASAVGANSLLCKVGALYHDIGKLSRPDYFVENQFGGPNPHDKLSPAMSALILCAHVKQGTELAEEHKLGREIIDIIAQHHGTRTILFFFQKALDMGENPRPEDYSYPGPRPQTKEAAIVMMADAVEASSRTLVDPTPARIRTHVENIIKGIYAEGQLDEADLTYRDLYKLMDSFVRILTGLFHQRIAYPDRTDAKESREGRCRCAEKNGDKADKSSDKGESRGEGKGAGKAADRSCDKRDRTTACGTGERPASPGPAEVSSLGAGSPVR